MLPKRHKMFMAVAVGPVMRCATIMLHLDWNNIEVLALDTVYADMLQATRDSLKALYHADMASIRPTSTCLSLFL